MPCVRQVITGLPETTMDNEEQWERSLAAGKSQVRKLTIVIAGDHVGIWKNTQTRTNIPGRWQNRHCSDGPWSTSWSDRRTRGHEEGCEPSCERRSRRDPSARWSRENS